MRLQSVLLYLLGVLHGADATLAALRSCSFLSSRSRLSNAVSVVTRLRTPRTAAFHRTYGDGPQSEPGKRKFQPSAKLWKQKAEVIPGGLIGEPESGYDTQ